MDALKLFRMPVIAVLAVFAGIVVTSCGDGVSEGGARVIVVSPLSTCDDIATVTVTITGPGISPDIVEDLAGTGCEWNKTISDIPGGTDRVFFARARDAADVLRYEGQATDVVIEGGKTALVSIVLQEVDPIDPFDNTAPVIDAVVASLAAVIPGGTLDIEVQAHDVDVDDTLSFLWTATGGTFSTPTLAATGWTAPDSEGVQTLTITVTDSHDAAVDARTQIDVQWGIGAATVEAEFNDWPFVSGIVPSRGLLTAGETITLDLSASDPDLDVLTYSWSDNGGECAGAFDDPNLEDPAWTAPAVLPASGRCTLSVVVSDGRGGAGAGTLTIHLGSMP